LKSKELLKYDVVVIGAGIVGLATARSIASLSPTMRVLIIDKEAHAGLHASGRNSGVLHAGFYYSPESLKAKFCRDGNLEMRMLAERHKVLVKQVGKVVVAQDSDDLPLMHKLFERGRENGVELEIHHGRRLKEYEPLAVTHEEFLWSPNTAVVDKGGIIQAMMSELKELKVDILFNQQFISNEGTLLHTTDFKINYRHLVNASGGSALSIAHKMGFGDNHEMIPFLGVYRGTTISSLPLRTLVYPVPHPENPFLGTHFTITTDGLVKIGPTAQPVLFSEQYSFGRGWNLAELIDSPKAMSIYFRNNVATAIYLIYTEFPQLLEAKLVKKSSRLVPDARNIKSWDRKPSGIRAQLLKADTKRLELDFVVEGDSKSTHLLNIVSPGWTSSIPFATWVCSNYVMPNL
jgi:L-2-hydroxyglutarate oxidase LhgO